MLIIVRQFITTYLMKALKNKTFIKHLFNQKTWVSYGYENL